MLTILFIYPHYPPYQESFGIGTYIAELSSRLVKSKKFKIIVVAKTFGQSIVENIGGVEVHRVSETSGFISGFFEKYFGNYFNHFFYGFHLNSYIKKLTKREKIDLIEICDFGGDGYLLINNTKILTVTRVHSPSFLIDSFQPYLPIFSSLTRYLEKIQLIKSKIIIVPSINFWQNKIKNLLPVKNPEQKLLIAPYVFVDFKTIPSKNKYIKDKMFKVLFVGRLDSLKGIEILAESFKIIQNSRKDLKIQLTLVGPNTANFDLQSLFNFSSEDNSNLKLVFNGIMTRQQVRNEYKKHDLFVFPSKIESVGYVAIEAMAAGLPVIGYDVGVLRKIIKDELNGYVIDDVGNPNLLAKYIIKCATNYKKTGIMGRKAKEIIKSYSKMSLLETIKFYNNLIER